MEWVQDNLAALETLIGLARRSGHHVFTLTTQDRIITKIHHGQDFLFEPS